MRYLLICLFLFASSVSARENPFANVEIQTTKLTDNIYMLTGAGGNIGVFVGDDGVILIDDQFAPLSVKIKAALAEISSEAPTFLLNTHYHGDHTGGNSNFSDESTIMAHHNVRLRLVKGNADKTALPVITYQEQASIHFDGEEIALYHQPKGHTDGDTMVHFTSSNVIHMGDNLFTNAFPYVDIDAGGSVDGMIHAVESMLPRINAETKVIAGHGALANRADVERYIQMLKDTKAEAKALIKDNLTLEAAIEKGLDPKWDGWGKGFINEERWIQTLYKSYNQ